MTEAELEQATTAAQAAKALVTMWRRRGRDTRWAGPQLEVLAGRDPAWRERGLKRAWPEESRLSAWTPPRRTSKRWPGPRRRVTAAR